jgi:hypothetical protein
LPFALALWWWSCWLLPSFFWELGLFLCVKDMDTEHQVCCIKELGYTHIPIREVHCKGKLSPSPCETHVSLIVSKPYHWALISRCINQAHRHSLHWHNMLPKSDWESLPTESVQKKARGQR